MNDKLSKLKWQCRRGSKELDLLLTEYLEHQYPTASQAEQARFVVMLEMDDAQLMPLMLDAKRIVDTISIA